MMKKNISGWVVAVSCAVVMALTMGIVAVFSVFMPAIMGDTGWSSAQVLYSMTALTIGGAVLGPFYGKIIKRFKAKWVMLIGALSMAICLIGWGLSQNWMVFTAFGLFSGVSLVFSGTTSFSALLSTWFDKNNNGLAFSIAVAGQPVGAMIFSPIAQNMIDVYGWRHSMIYLGVGVAVILTIVISAFVRTSTDTGKNDLSQEKTTEEQDNGAKFGKTPVFWLVAIGILMFGIAACQTGMYLVAFLQTHGMEPMTSAYFNSIFVAMQIVVIAIMGKLIDKRGVKFYIILAIACGIAGTAIISFCGLKIVPLLIGMLLYTAMYTLTTVAANSVVKDIFGAENVGKVIGSIITFQSIGGILTTPILGNLFDATGNWTLMFFVAAGICVIGAVLLLIAMNAQKRNHNVLN